MGGSRDSFYRYQELVEDGDIDQLIYKSRRAPNIKNRVNEMTEQAVLSFVNLYGGIFKYENNNE